MKRFKLCIEIWRNTINIVQYFLYSSHLLMKMEFNININVYDNTSNKLLIILINKLLVGKKGGKV